MENYFGPIDKLNLNGNMAEEWRKFQQFQKFENFMNLANLSRISEERKIAILLKLVGHDGVDLYNTFKPLAEEDKIQENIIQQFKQQLEPSKNQIHERSLFNNIAQKEGHNFDSFIAELRTAVKTTG